MNTASSPIMVHRPHRTLLDKTVTLGSWVLAGAIFLSVGWLAMKPEDPLGAVTVLTRDGGLLVLLQAGALAGVAAAIATVIAGRYLADVGTFAAAVGLAAVSLRGGTAGTLLVHFADTTPSFELPPPPEPIAPTPVELEPVVSKPVEPEPLDITDLTIPGMDATEVALAREEREVMRALTQLPQGLPTALGGWDMAALARAVLSGDRRTLPDGTEVVNINGKWYNADRTNAGRFMREHKGPDVPAPPRPATTDVQAVTAVRRARTKASVPKT